MKTIIFLLFLLLTRGAKAGEIEIAHFAAEGYSKQQCKVALDGYKGIKKPTFSFIFKTFRRSGECPKEFIRRYSAKAHEIKIYATNETCRRGLRFCSAHKEASPGYRAKEYSRALEDSSRLVVSALSHRARNIRNWIGRNTEHNTRVYLVTGLEDDFTDSAYKVVIKIYRRVLLKPYFKRVILVRNPNGSNALNFSSRGAEFIELHPLRSNFAGKRGIWSNDGYDLRLAGRQHQINPSISIEQLGTLARWYLSGGNRVQIWWNTQGIERHGFIEPDNRTFNVNRGDSEVVRRLALSLLENQK